MTPPPPGRNAPCPCGSGRKYKHCCLVSARPSAYPQALQHYQRGELGPALQVARQGLAAQPLDARLHVIAGLCLLQGSQPGAAEPHLRQALQLDPRNVDAALNLGVLLAGRGQADEAERCYRQGLQLDPANVLGLLNLGDLLARDGRDGEAERCFVAAVAARPGFGGAHHALAHLRAALGRRDEAEQGYRAALQIDPGDLRSRYNLAVLLLARGRYEEGWALHEVRTTPGFPLRDTRPPPVSAPRWAGEPLAGRRLLVWPEQGLGDEIQFARYLAARDWAPGAQVTLACRPALLPLFAASGLADAVRASNDPALREQRFDAWTYTMSLPWHAGTRLDSVPAALPYLCAPAERSAHWQARLQATDGGLRIGLVWKGAPGHANDHHRSLPGLAALRPLWQAARPLRFISLQKGAGEDEARDPPPDQPLRHLGGEIADFADSAAIVAQLDLVICVDTAIAHLAGALGIPCWVLLPATDTDWRWLLERDDSPWYPGVLRLFRQRQAGDWAEVIARVRDALAALPPARR
ncbi:MAG TPA: tetratricopeptide repeat protein [Methylibium sp.]|nr:tetratricopeptide repeat protein [Methylibium sp.]